MYKRACVLISGGMTNRPRTMPITSPSPTPGSTQRMLGTNSGGSTAGVRAAYTTNHPYSGAPISTTAPYGGSGVPYSTAPTSSYGGGVPSQGGYAGVGRGMQQRPMQQYTSGQGQSGQLHMTACYCISRKTNLQRTRHEYQVIIHIHVQCTLVLESTL